ncbi:uncharacterized protein LOC130441151 [Diorhabda sublineata]|uniref:uncharacterized protein LOC130441151 n=1 Tax=Diorhabda sublineata TaxID=1163346 RepID=UPI0024E06F40|nr:uncharacterized protein LOC130441151 [Diorhabda sublineata]
MKVGLEINLDKTKFITNLVTNDNIIIDGGEIAQVYDYKYRRYEVRIGRDNQTCEIKRRILLGWIAFGKLSSTLKSDLPISLKRKVYEQCVIPVMSYGAETLTLTRQTAGKMRVAQRAMERQCWELREGIELQMRT